MMKHGLLVKANKQNLIHLLPPLNITEKDIMKAATIIRHCLENNRGNCEENNVIVPKTLKIIPGEDDLFRNSLFPNVPPYVKFFMHDLKGNQ